MARAQHSRQELFVCLGVALLMISALVAANAAEPREETGFGSNPGNLRMFSYVPADREAAAPLIVGFSRPATHLDGAGPRTTHRNGCCAR